MNSEYNTIMANVQAVDILLNDYDYHMYDITKEKVCYMRVDLQHNICVKVKITLDAVGTAYILSERMFSSGFSCTAALCTRDLDAFCKRATLLEELAKCYGKEESENE